MAMSGEIDNKSSCVPSLVEILAFIYVVFSGFILWCILEAKLLMRNNKAQIARHENITWICLFQVFFPRLLGHYKIKYSIRHSSVVSSSLSLWTCEWAGADWVWCITFPSGSILCLHTDKSRASHYSLIKFGLRVGWSLKYPAITAARKHHPAMGIKRKYLLSLKETGGSV